MSTVWPRVDSLVLDEQTELYELTSLGGAQQEGEEVVDDADEEKEEEEEEELLGDSTKFLRHLESSSPSPSQPLNMVELEQCGDLAMSAYDACGVHPLEVDFFLTLHLGVVDDAGNECIESVSEILSQGTAEETDLRRLRCRFSKLRDWRL